MFYTSQRTIYGLDLSLAQTLGVEYKVKPNTTLNEKLNILPEAEKPQGVYPILRYIGIGCGGQSMSEIPGVYPYSFHQPIDAAPFRMMPFLIREEGRDINYAERQKYRLRKELSIDGRKYIAYYLKALVPDKDIIYKDDFIQFSKTVNPLSFEDKDVLNPTPVSKIDKILSNNAVYTSKMVKIVFELTEEEVKEVNNVFAVMGGLLFPGYTGNINKAITEICLCTGIDKVNEDGGIESICTQVSHHIGVSLEIDVDFNNRLSYYKIFNLGGIEPLYMQ